MKKTLEALAMLGVVAGGSGPVREALDAALKEVAAVRKAAGDWAASDCGELPEDSADVMERIAAEVLASGDA